MRDRIARGSEWIYLIASHMGSPYDPPLGRKPESSSLKQTYQRVLSVYHRMQWIHYFCHGSNVHRLLLLLQIVLYACWRASVTARWGNCSVRGWGMHNKTSGVLHSARTTTKHYCPSWREVYGEALWWGPFGLDHTCPSYKSRCSPDLGTRKILRKFRCRKRLVVLVLILMKNEREGETNIWSGVKSTPLQARVLVLTVVQLQLTLYSIQIILKNPSFSDTIQKGAGFNWGISATDKYSLRFYCNQNRWIILAGLEQGRGPWLLILRAVVAVVLGTMLRN